MWFALALVTLANFDEPRTELPEALQRAKEARAALQTARLDFSIEGVVDDEGYRSTSFFTWRAAGDDYLVVNHGDQNGVYAYGPDGRPVPGTLNSARNSLFHDGRVWSKKAEGSIAYVSESADVSEPVLYNWRNIGLNPLRSGQDLDEYLAKIGATPLTYDVRIEGNQQVVTGHTRRDGGEVEYRWHVDPARGWNITRTEVYKDDRPVIVTEYDPKLSFQDGLWFPSKIEVYGFPDGHKQLRQTTKIYTAQFNRPEHPDELTPLDIGLEVGTSILSQDREAYPSGVWDGQTTISPEEFAHRVQSGELEIGPGVLRNSARARAFSDHGGLERAAERYRKFARDAGIEIPPDLTVRALPFESVWERYTREFITHYQLDDEQAQRAWAICNDCQDAARNLARPAEREIADKQAEVGKLEADDKARNEVAITKLREQIDQRRAALTQRIDDIFVKQLKPRLAKVPTRKQQADAGPFDSGAEPQSAQAGADEP